MAETKSRDFIANHLNWNPDLDKLAKIHAKQSYFSISSFGYKDRFNSIRSALWQHRNEKCTILVGCLWEAEWESAKNGIIPKEKGIPLFGHAFKLYGQKVIDGELYLVAQLSNGTGIGDNGIFYFPREVVNRKFTFGAFMFKDIDPNEAKKQLWSPMRRFWERVKSCFKEWCEIAFS